MTARTCATSVPQPPPATKSLGKTRTNPSQEPERFLSLRCSQICLKDKPLLSLIRYPPRLFNKILRLQALFQLSLIRAHQDLLQLSLSARSNTSDLSLRRTMSK